MMKFYSLLTNLFKKKVSNTTVDKIIGLYETYNIDNVKLAIQLTEHYINDKKLLKYLNEIINHRINYNLILLILESSWWDKIYFIKNCKSCYLYDKGLTSIPKNIGKLNKVEYINLSHNFLTEIPKEIGDLENLYNLNLSHNQLTFLPEEISKLKNLENLFLGYNKFTKKERLKIANLLPNTKIFFKK